MIKFLVFSRRGFANDRCMIAYDTDKVGNHIGEETFTWRNFERIFNDFPYGRGCGWSLPELDRAIHIYKIKK